MTNWIEHDGGPQPVGDDVWVEIVWPNPEGRYLSFGDEIEQASEIPWEGHKFRFRILNQHLIDAARLEGIRLGLEAAAKDAEMYVEACRNEGVGLAMMAFACHADDIRNLDPETIAREAQDMGSGKETT